MLLEGSEHVAMRGVVVDQVVESVSGRQGVGRQLTRVEHNPGGTDEPVNESQGRSGIVGAGDVVRDLRPQANRLDAGGVMGHLKCGLHSRRHVEGGRCETE